MYQVILSQKSPPLGVLKVRAWIISLVPHTEKFCFSVHLEMFGYNSQQATYKVFTRHRSLLVFPTFQLPISMLMVRKLMVAGFWSTWKGVAPSRAGCPGDQVSHIIRQSSSILTKHLHHILCTMKVLSLNMRGVRLSPVFFFPPTARVRLASKF